MRKGTKKIRHLIAMCLSVAMILSVGTLNNSAIIEAMTDYGVSDPVVLYQGSDTIYFGNYWQDDTNGDGTADQNDSKTPIKWRILEQDGEDLFLMADQALDCQPYNDEEAEVTWETCSLRKWLNNDFYNSAFSSAEKASIQETTVLNEDNEKYDSEGGNSTTDKIYLLSTSEVNDPNYGFVNGQARQALLTDYAIDKGACKNKENISWWLLRSPGGDLKHAAEASYDSYVVHYGCSVDYQYDGIRPVMHVNVADAIISSALSNKSHEQIAIIKSTWDTVTFGKYNGEDITWRVLSVDGDDAILLADKVLDIKQYCADRLADVTWETSPLRTWLNEDFYNEAFTYEEQTAIRQVTLENADNPYHNVKGGNDTTDNIYLLSLADVMNPQYGFPTTCTSYTTLRQAVDADGKEVCWWLRSPGKQSYIGAYVYDYGYVFDNTIYIEVTWKGVRPALHLDLSSSVWAESGEVRMIDIGEVTVTSDEEESEKENNTSSSNTVNNSTSNTSIKESPQTNTTTAKKTVKLKNLRFKKKSKKLTGKVTRRSKVVVTLYNKKHKKIKKIKIKASKTKRGRFVVKLGSKAKKGCRVKVKATKNGYKSKTKSYVL